MTTKSINETRFNPIDEPDVSNATFISWHEIPPHEEWEADFYPLNKREWFKEIDEYNGEGRNGNWWHESYRLHLANKSLIRTFVSQLELTPRQAKRAERWFLSLDLNKWGVRKGIVAYCICAYFVHSDERDCRKCHPATPDETKHQLFRNMEKTLGLRDGSAMGTSRLHSIYGKVRVHVETTPSPPQIDPFDKYAEFESAGGQFVPDESESTWWREEGI